jgi:N-acetylneuraminate synthase/N,N'-diacetyllegionaminate synthase
MVVAIRNIEQAISGSGIKEPSESEMKNVRIVRKSLHYKTDLNPGHILAEEDVLILRPAYGISPMEIDSLLGKTIRNKVTSGNLIDFKDFDNHR